MDFVPFYNTAQQNRVGWFWKVELFLTHHSILKTLDSGHSKWAKCVWHCL